ncbi:UNC93-like protein [Lachnellula willkommii]|uniref:UNC93-like protein n=1 Tax=Lachnellula willkommii TaxID=215461 RepID=A0A559MGD3_9HELO|nr:UNC93-like protein [Lachnellula willkommii]
MGDQSVSDMSGSKETVPTHIADENDNAKRTWYRTTFFQTTVVGLAAFAAPGLYNAMQATGAGGQQTPYLVMAGNAILNCCMVLTCVFGSVFSNRFGIKATFVTGTTGYAIYSASMYCNNRYGTEWFIYIGSAACGLTAGLFWAAEGAIMLGYPEPHKRGRYLAYWLAYRNSGSILGGIINLALNYDNKKTGKLNYKTYIVFISLQCLGPFVAMLLSPPHKVQRKDRTKVDLGEKISDKDELKALGKLIISKDILCIVPLFLYAIFELSYIGSYLSLYFSVRSRALASLIAALCQITSNAMFGSFLDWRKLTLNTRARYAFIFMMTLIGGCWIWGTIVQVQYTHHKPALDWLDAGFGRGWALYIFWQINFYCYWMVGFMAKEPRELVRYTSIVRGVEAAGGAIASGISSTKAPLTAALGINFGLWAVCLIPAWIVIRKLGLRDPETSIEESIEMPPKIEVEI